MNQAAQACLLPVGQTPALWRVLDTEFDFLRLCALWQAWQGLSGAGVLHVVALCTELAPISTLDTPQGQAGAQALAHELRKSWRGLLPGMHRFMLGQGRLQFTLCIGELQGLLREQVFFADAIYLNPKRAWTQAQFKALARCRQRGTLLCGLPPESPHAPMLREIGFVAEAAGWRCAPPWTLRLRRERIEAAPVQHCAVIGAGLAGASVAAALALRGWQVQVLDAAAEAAAGASSLPVGLLMPHITAHDGPRSRLARAGLHLMRQELERLLVRGQDWDACGVLELRPAGKSGLGPHWPEAAQMHTRLGTLAGNAAWLADLAEVTPLWHPQAAWVKPVPLVRAWLASPGVHFLGRSRVSALRRVESGWQLCDAAGKVLCSAPQVVLANALDAPRLLASLGCTLPALHGMRGVLSWGVHETASAAPPWLPPHPVSGAGSFIPRVPTPEGLAWYAGSTYENTAQPPAPQAAHLQADWEQLERLLPATAQALAPSWHSGKVRAWEAVRCVSGNRLPLLGPLEDGPRPTLWISAAMGSRGLSLARLCAELLAAQLGAEPWPLEASLARALQARRRQAKGEFRA